MNIYQTFHRANGTTVKLAPDRGEGQHWNLAPGNLYSKPAKVHIDGHTKLAVLLTETIPPIPPQPDTKYIRHIRIQSELLTKFWGTPMYLSAIVLVPEGFDEHPNAHFPIAIFHDHFVNGMDDFRTSPPDPDLKPDYSERFHLAGYNRIQQEEAYKEYQQWISPGFPRILVLKIQHANPFFDDSYAVNTAKLRSVRRCDPERVAPRTSRRTSACCAERGRALRRAARPAAGSRSRYKCSIPGITTAPLSLVLTRLTFMPT